MLKPPQLCWMSSQCVSLQHSFKCSHACVCPDTQIRREHLLQTRLRYVTVHEDAIFLQSYQRRIKLYRFNCTVPVMSHDSLSVNMSLL